MKGRIDKRTWGVLGKQQTYYSPQQFLQGKTKTPLNGNPFDSWDVKRSRYNRIDGYENAIQQGGVVPQDLVSPTVTTTPSPTPSLTPTITSTETSTPTPTPSVTQTQTPSITPSSTPYPLPIQPNLWFDGSDPAYMSLILSGGNQYLSSWTSKGTNGWVLTAANTNEMCIVSGSSQMPGSPNIVRFVTGTTGNIKSYRSFNNSILGFTGGTYFMVYSLIPGTQIQILQNRVYSGLTNGAVILVPPLNFVANLQSHTPAGNFIQSISTTAVNYTQNISAISGVALNNKLLVRTSFPNATNQFGVFEINQSAGTFTNTFTGVSATGSVNTYNLGCVIQSGGTISPSPSNYELAEIMWFNTTLSNSDVEAVELYLKDKWRYDEWASPVPTATPTASNTSTPTPSVTNTSTPTPSVTNTQTATVTQTPSPTQTFTPTPSPTPFNTEYQTILNRGVALGYTLPSDAEKNKQNQLISDLKSNNIWGDLGLFYLFNQDTSISGSTGFTMINWITPSETVASLQLLGTGTTLPTFVSDSGWSMTNQNRIRTGVNPNSASVNPLSTSGGGMEGVWVISTGTSSSSGTNLLFGTDNNGWNRMLSNDSTGHWAFRGVGLTSNMDMTGTGFRAMSLSGAISAVTTVTFFTDNTATDRTKTTTDTNNAGGVMFLNGSDSSTSWTWTCATFFSGKAMSNSKMSTFYSLLNTYFTT